MQALGCEVAAINTVNFSMLQPALTYAVPASTSFTILRYSYRLLTEPGNHTGYRQFKGTRTSPEDIKDLYKGLTDSHLVDFDVLLSGYIPSAEALHEVSIIARDLKTKHEFMKPGSFFWILDPVMGDQGRLYVSQDLVQGYKNVIRGGQERPDLIVPNGFVQRMPYLKDRIQGTLLRKQPARPDAKPRPRSELSLRKSTDLSGILGSKSPLDHVPAELLDDIEALISPLDDTRQLLRRDRAMALSPQQQREVAVGEQIIGQIDRGSIVLAAKGRREGSHDREGRITLEEKQRLQTVAHIRHDLRTQRLLESTDRGRPAIPVPSALPETYPTSSSSHLKASSEILAQLHGVKTNTNKQLVSDAANDQVQDTPSQLPTKSGSELVTKPFDKLSVSEQLERLESYRESIAERSQSLFSTASEPKSSKLAIPYASLRRTRRIHANRQRAVTQAIIRKAGEHQFSARSRSQTWNSLRVLQSQELARQRRALILQQEQDLKAGKRLPPMPKTRRTVRRSRNLNNPNIRFVSDLNRKKWRYQVRRGLKLDPRLLAAESKEQKQVPSAQVAETELETVQRRHPVLTKIREMEMKDNARGSPADSTQQRKTRRRKPKAIQLGIPTPKPETNFKPITLDDT